jgi:hypothetical protein
MERLVFVGWPGFTGALRGVLFFLDFRLIVVLEWEVLVRRVTRLPRYGAEVARAVSKLVRNGQWW